MNLQQPQSCTKCGSLPQDILMLACNHDLCLNCASNRLAFEFKKNKNANVIVCAQCHQKTPLDSQSVQVLKSLMKTSSSSIQATPVHPSQIDSKYNPQLPSDRQSKPAYSYTKTSSLGIDRGLQRTNNEKVNNSKLSNANPYNNSNSQVFNGISSKKNCVQHHDEEILYFCFDCKCQCICPECVIHGKHKDHDVKTVRKAQPIVKTQIQSYLNRIEGNIENLLIKRSQIEKQVRSMNQQNNISKRQIQQAFEDLRAKIAVQQKQLLSKCDQSLQQNISQLQKCQLQIQQKTDQLRSMTSSMNQSTRRQEIQFLNFYSRKCKQIQLYSREIQVQIPNLQLSSNQPYLSQILDANDAVGRVGHLQRGGRMYHQN